MAIKDLTIAQLRTIVAIEDNGSLVAAAEVLFITQPTAAYRVREVSTALGIKLYKRQGRNNVLTKKGQRVLQYARQIVDLHDSMTNSFKTKSDKGE